LEEHQKRVSQRNSSLLDRFTGCLLALACGDALGGPVEFDSRESIERRYPDGLRDFIGGGWQHLRPGEITDDTTMALDLARSLTATGSLDLEDMAGRWVAWNQNGPKDVGLTTKMALDFIAAGDPWHRAGERTVEVRGADSSAGNGSVMRCAPVALRYRNNKEQLVQASIDTARITHAEPRAIWGAVAINQAIAHLLEGHSRETGIEAAVNGIENKTVVDAIRSASTLHRDQVPSGGYVISTVTAAFWSLFTFDTLEEVLIGAVALGEDTDTTAAVAGALAGAHFGAGAIPNRWLELLEPRKDLEQLAAELLELSMNDGPDS
jgi:ADP-ribosyl-[dinitrogen reductase] hydrolase